MMKLFVLLLFVVAPFVSRVAVVAVPEVRCDVENFGVVQELGRFSLKLPTRDLMGKTYECTCATAECLKVNCVFLGVQVTTVDISARAPPVVEESSRAVDECFDAVLQMSVSRGETYTRPGKPMLGCQCPETGDANIICEDLTCKYDIGPTDLLTPPKTPGHCTNPWTQQTHARQERFNHTMIVNKYQKMTNTLMCSCDDGLVMCNLMDHLCCDEKTGELKKVGEKFHKTHPQYTYVMCGCAPVEMSCTTIPQVTEAITTTRAPRRRPRPRPTEPPRKEDGCFDKESNQYVDAGASYAHLQPDGTVRECKCKRRRRKKGRKRKSRLRCKNQ